ncbi:sulfotransferase domain-containing protein [Novosphingobium beihaiensis]|uniref:Sulfotransferase domain-containing protein n=1 Tax=Novosphingobium beihaiensis TaxID=2930389 RepID=A0ABT0BPT9_9SPHN|nr:sulfotransferase domain-containing protein [Novosphingobium beihaiensis]MCJ2187061.1 sulfotransferase domain-containing protein [Novosphingobium beihaiensis]
MAKINLIATYPKSGTTWTRILLDSLRQGGAEVGINGVSLTIHLSYRYWIDEQLMMETVDLPKEWQRGLQGRALRALHEDGTERTMFGTTHAAHPEAVDAELLFPPTTVERVLYMVRNPLSVAPSYADFMGLPLDRAIDQLADPRNTLGVGSDIHHGPNFPAFLGSWSQHVRSWRESGLEVMIVRYEDLLDDGHHTLTSIARFLGLPDDGAVVETALGSHRFDRLRQQEAQDGFVGSHYREKRFFRSGSSTAWRSELSAPQVARIVEVHGEEMARYGYLP